MIVIDREIDRSTNTARTKEIKCMWVIRVKVYNEVIPEIRFNVIFNYELRSMIRMNTNHIGWSNNVGQSVFVR